MGQSYTVQQGDHISALAAKFGFADYKTIWDDPGNADLKSKRSNPHILFPGDVLFIPDKGSKWEDGATANVHSFQVRLQPLQLRLILKDFDNEPIANVDCELEVEGNKQRLKSDATGLIETKVPRTARSGILNIPDLDLEIPVSIGELDPFDKESGWKMRLINLGYFNGELTAALDDPELVSALQEFQCDQHLKISGKADSTTIQKLREVHGV